MISRVSVLVTILVIISLSLGVASMAEASLPQQPDGALCIVEPRDLAEIAVLTSSPPPERSEADEIEWDDARAATEEEVIGLTQLFLEFFACYNLGDYSRLAALFTDDALSRGFVSEIVYEPPDELKVRFEGVYAGYMFSDGRLGAVLVTSTPAEFAPLQSMFFFLKLVNGRWLIDDVPPSGVTVRVPQ